MWPNKTWNWWLFMAYDVKGVNMPSGNEAAAQWTAINSRRTRANPFSIMTERIRHSIVYCRSTWLLSRRAGPPPFHVWAKPSSKFLWTSRLYTYNHDHGPSPCIPFTLVYASTHRMQIRPATTKLSLSATPETLPWLCNRKHPVNYSDKQ